MLSYIIMIGEFLIIIYAVNMIRNSDKIKYFKFKENNNNIYQVKPLMTDYEYKFFNILKNIENVYSIVPQLNLASIIRKTNNDRYYNELFRNIDFAIFTKDYKKLLLLIEINDNTHNQPKRKERDLKVKSICNDANIRLITFYTNKPNDPNYVIKRILDEINKINNENTIQINLSE